MLNVRTQIMTTKFSNKNRNNMSTLIVWASVRFISHEIRKLTVPPFKNTEFNADITNKMQISTYKVKRHFFRHGHPTSPKFGTHVRIETRLALTQICFGPPHSNRNPFLSKAVRPSRRRLQAVRPLWTHQLCVAWLFGEVLLYQHQRIVTMTKGYIASNNLPVEIIRFHTIYDDFSDI